MAKRILITGGAGFIGSYLADALLRRGYAARALDNLSAQVHGPDAGRPAYLDLDVELHVGDIADPGAVCSALRGVDGVFHLASTVGVGQSYVTTTAAEGHNARTKALMNERRYDA
jgi:dTDP-L-rhamnose 4-epimerase